MEILRKSAGDEAWELLPFLYAAAFYSNPVTSTVFNSSANGHVNNVHCMPFAVIDLVVGVAGLQNLDKRKLRRRVEHVLEAAAAQVLRLVEGAKDGSVKGYADLPGAVLLIDATLIAARSLTDRAALERVLPYNLLRQHYTEAYEQRKINGQLTDTF